MADSQKEADLKRLLDRFDRCENNEGSVTLLDGPIGCGKSETLRIFGERIRSRGLLLRAFCTRREHDVPLSTIDQLLCNAVPAGDGHAELTGLRARMTAGADLEVMRDFTKSLLKLATRTPVAVLVDDVHLADAESRRYLLYLVHRLCASRVFAVFSEHSPSGPEHQKFRAEVQGLPHAHRLSTRPLARTATAELVAAELEIPPDHPLTADFHAVSGGNPLLVRGLLDETRRLLDLREEDEPTELSGGKELGQFVLGRLHHAEPGTQYVAEGLAVLNDRATPRSVAELVELDPMTVAHMLHSLDSARMVTNGRLRHPVLARSILDGMPSERRAVLHRRAAEQSFRDGASAPAIARHLLSSDRLDGAWTVPVLKEAAKQALIEDQVELGLAFLNAALHACTDSAEIARLRTIRARAERRNDLLASFRVAVPDGAPVPAEHTDLLAWLQPGAADEAQVLRTLERLHLIQPSATTAERFRQAATVIAASTGQERLASRALITTLTRGADDFSLGEVKALLHNSSVSEFTVNGIVLALLTLIYADQLRTAQFWCDLFMKQVASRKASAWQASFAAIRAEIALRQGELEAVHDHAGTALELMPDHSFGVCVGLPLAALVRAATETGHHEEAAELLSRPVPQAMFDTRFGIHYRSARGHHYLATGRPQAALEEFRYCGALIQEWGFDQPSLAPWRSDQALALLRLGGRRKARKLAADQLERSFEGSRSHGISLYVLALAGEPAQRPSSLRKAIQVLEGCGDRLHLSRALADLAELTREPVGSAVTRDPFRRQIGVSRPGADSPDHHAGGALQAPRADDDRLAELSKAERRVAVLAAASCSNREISRRLHVTVSTVEQHLTRIYRKLGVSRRVELVQRFGDDLTGNLRPLHGPRAS